MRSLETLFHNLAKALEDPLLQRLLLGVISVAVACAFVFEDVGLVLGILLVGGISAVIESNAHRDMSDR